MKSEIPECLNKYDSHSGHGLIRLAKANSVQEACIKFLAVHTLRF